MNITNFLIPNLPTVTPVQKDGTFHPSWQQWLQQLVAVLQNNLSQQGFKLPQQPTTIITTLNTPESNGAIIYDSTIQKGKLNENGTFKTIMTM